MYTFINIEFIFICKHIMIIIIMIIHKNIFILKNICTKNESCKFIIYILFPNLWLKIKKSINTYCPLNTKMTINNIY